MNSNKHFKVELPDCINKFAKLLTMFLVFLLFCICLLLSFFNGTKVLIIQKIWQPCFEVSIVENYFGGKTLVRAPNIIRLASRFCFIEQVFKSYKWIFIWEA